MKKDIKSQIEIIERSINWAKKHGRDSFPLEEMKEYRRKLNRIYYALEENCSAAAYGESQVGKSYLMSSLLSTPDKPLVIANNGKEYSFIDDLNPSGGNTSKTESTGVVTRFTINGGNEKMKDFVKIRNLSVADIIMLLADSYYNDLKIEVSSVLRYDQINEGLSKLHLLWAGKNEPVQTFLTEDDIKDICDYIRDVIGNNAANVSQSDFRKTVADNIQFVPVENWVDLFSLLWNKNSEMSRLFSILINEYRLIQFKSEVYVPFSAVLRDQGTLLKIEWLNSVCGMTDGDTKDVTTTDVYDTDGIRLAENFKKSSLSALIAELTFILPKDIAEERPFLRKIDLLDFPGARSREKFKEQDLKEVLPTVLRRGKVAYLFNKYSRSLRISSVLFCHHNDQKNEPTLGDTVNSWIEDNVGHTPEERGENLKRTSGISPLFFVATKFNIELERSKIDTPQNVDKLDDHWKRFKTVYPEIIKPATWFDNWVTPEGIFRTSAFQSIYLLRDFYWSSKNNVFDGYVENQSEETGIHQFADYPNFFDNLRDSFIHNDFVKTHFAYPEQSWEEVATINNDGSKAIIRDLNAISGELDDARRGKYIKELREIRDEILLKLNTYYEPEDKEQNNARTRTIIGEIRRGLELNIGIHPEIFGRIIDQLMLPVGDVRKITYDIIILKSETPKDFNEVTLIRTLVGINLKDDKQTNIQRLCKHYACDENTLREEFGMKGFTLEDIVTNECRLATTVAEVVSNAVLECWAAYINRQVKAISSALPHADEVALMLQTLCKQLKIKDKITEKIDTYSKVFPVDDLPNAIADFSCLVLNNFVSTVGREYMDANDIKTVSDKASSCHLEIDLSPQAIDISRKDTDLIAALNAFDEATDPTAVSPNVLMKLPFWDNFQRWENLIAVGLLYSSDISHVDPVANAEIKEIIDNCETLYR